MISKLKKLLFEKNMLSLSTSVIGAVLGLASFMLLTRQLEQKMFGDWVLFITLATFFDLLRFGLTSTALIRFSSGDDVDTNRTYLGTSFKIGIVLVLVLAVVFAPVVLVIKKMDITINDGYLLFFTYYPILALVNLSWNNATSYFQAKQKFGLILLLRVLNMGVFVLFLVANKFFLNWSLQAIVLVFLGANLLTSVLSAVKKWDGMSYIKKATKPSIQEMLDFGKYSMGTLIGSSLLKSADTVIIGLSPILGSVGVAQYAIPLKLTDLLGIPLRSFTVTAFPKMAKKSIAGDEEGVKSIFYSYSGIVTLLFIPVAVVGFIFAEPLVYFLGGNEFKESLPLLATVFRIFALYSILLPIDRFTGVVLDSINKPRLNFHKVVVMTLANIVGDFIAVFVFNSLEAVAAVTVLFTFIGIILGYYYVHRELKLDAKRFAVELVLFYKNIKTYL